MERAPLPTDDPQALLRRYGRADDAAIDLADAALALAALSRPESALAPYLNNLLVAFPSLLLGSYPEFSNPEYKVKVTLESKDRGYMERALGELLERLPPSSLVRVQR